MRDDDLAAHVTDYFASGAAREDREASMNFVHIDPWHVVNLDNVTEVYLTHSAGISGSRTAIIVNFVSDTLLTIYDDNPSFAVLKGWLDEQPPIDDISEEEWSDADDAFTHLDYAAQGDVEHTRNGYGATDLVARTNALLDSIYRKEE